MIETFEDLGFHELGKEEDIEGPVQPIDPVEEAKQFVAQIDSILQEKLGVSIELLKKQLSDYTVAHAEELTHDFVSVAPYGDYSKLLEDNDSMAEFFKTEAHKIENWRLVGITPSDVKKDLITFNFSNKSVDDGDNFEGFVYVSFQGKIRHAFAQGS